MRDTSTETRRNRLTQHARSLQENLQSMTQQYDREQQYAMRVPRGQQLAVGGVDIEGGQGESDSIFGSHDDHSTYGLLLPPFPHPHCMTCLCE